MNQRMDICCEISFKIQAITSNRIIRKEYLHRAKRLHFHQRLVGEIIERVLDHWR